MSIQLSKIARKVLVESGNVLDMTVKNPKTGHDIKVATALSYGASHPAYAAATKLHQQHTGEAAPQPSAGGMMDKFKDKVKRAVQIRPEYKVASLDQLGDVLGDVIKNKKTFDDGDAAKVIRNFHDMPMHELSQVGHSVAKVAHAMMTGHQDIVRRVKSGEMKNSSHVKAAVKQSQGTVLAFARIAKSADLIYAKRQSETR